MGNCFSSKEQVQRTQCIRSIPERGSTSHRKSQAEFDVFLSFRGPDTRTNFTDTLYYALLDKGISVFIDKKGVDVGGEIGPEIFKAIDDSKICIPVLSRGYASSRWCLRALEYMMERRKTNELEVLPIFYDVKASDVKLETRVYKEALAQHEAKLGPEVVRRWEEALKEVTGIKGWDTKNIGHGELTRLIAWKVLVKLKVSPIHLPYHLVGIDQSVDGVLHLLGVKSKDIRLVGICGIGGVGKTTLAKVVFHKLSAHFESCSFIPDVRQKSESSNHGLLHLQKQLVYDILGDKTIEVSSIDKGKNIIKERFSRKKVLIVLDDVNHREQLDALAAKREWFGLGSKIVVTTSNKNVLFAFQDQFENSSTYEVEGLSSRDSLQLFSKHAFRSNSPPCDFLSLSEIIAAKTGGLPLTIEVMGSFLHQKGKAVWEDTIKKMEDFIHEDVEKKLMLSYEALDDKQKQIFLDIACFLAGENKRNAAYMWNDCELYPDEGIEVLLLMSLIKIGVKNELWMHDQLKNLGRKIVCNENCKDPGKRSRVWNHEEALDMITSNKGTDTVEAICVNFDGTSLTSKDFVQMPNIRFLRMISGNLSGDFGGLFSKVRWLSWKNCPPNLQATNFCPKNLLLLDLSRTEITESWNGWAQLEVAIGLKVLNLSMCPNMIQVPTSIGAFVNLECLAVFGALKLTTIPNSIGMLKSLVGLDISNTSIANFPNTIIGLKSLNVLKMNRTCMQKLPKAIGILEKLEEIYGEYCLQLEIIPDSIARLPFLKILKLTETSVKNVPKLPKSLVNLCLSSSASEKAPEISNLVNLRNLDLCFPSGHDPLAFPESRTYSSSCKLELPRITSISSYLSFLFCVKELHLNNCKNLRRIGQLPSTLRKLIVDDCNCLEVVDLSNLENLLELSLDSQILNIQGLEDLTSLQWLRVSRCRSRKFSGLERLENLRILIINECCYLQTLPDLSNFENLIECQLWDCPTVVEIQGLDRLESLENLQIGYCNSLRSLPNLSNLKKLKHCYVDFLSHDTRR